MVTLQFYFPDVGMWALLLLAFQQAHRSLVLVVTGFVVGTNLRRVAKTLGPLSAEDAKALVKSVACLSLCFRILANEMLLHIVGSLFSHGFICCLSFHITPKITLTNIVLLLSYFIFFLWHSSL
jgi:hypothetical protein